MVSKERFLAFFASKRMPQWEASLGATDCCDWTCQFRGFARTIGDCGYLTSSVAIGWPLDVPCTAIFAAVVAKVFLCWFKKDAAGRIADREVIRGAVREAIRREETRDEAIVTISDTYTYEDTQLGWTREEKLSRTQRRLQE